MRDQGVGWGLTYFSEGRQAKDAVSQSHEHSLQTENEVAAHLESPGLAELLAGGLSQAGHCRRIPFIPSETPLPWGSELATPTSVRLHLPSGHRRRG